MNEWLDVGTGHQLYIERFGNPTGIPVVFLHGGPASGCNPAQAALFPLTDCQLIQFDQRGCGRSLALAPLATNTTQDLVADLERIRKHYGYPQWYVYGGSWGAALALEYAKQYPERMLGLLLRGSFLARRRDLDWFIAADGLAERLPDAYAWLSGVLGSPTPKNEGNTLTHFHHLLMDHTLPLTQRYAYCLAWDAWEHAAMGFGFRAPNLSEEALANIDTATQQKALRRFRIYSHYGVNGFFMPDENLGALADIERLHDIPAIAIHGRQDQVCPLHLASDLTQHWSTLNWREIEAGHGMEHPAMQQAVKLAALELLGLTTSNAVGG